MTVGGDDIKSCVWVLVEPLPCDTALSQAVRRSNDRRMRLQVPPTIVCGMPLSEQEQLRKAAHRKPGHVAVGDPECQATQ